MIRRLLVAAAVASLAGCSSSPSSPSSTPAGGGGDQSLVRAADLQPCPRSQPTPVAGGLPDLTLACLGAGPPVHMAGLVGMPTVVNIWASWCRECQREEGYFASVSDALRGQVRFLGVDTDDSDGSALDYKASMHPAARYPSVVDDDKQFLLTATHAIGPPVTLFVDATGHLVATEYGEYRSADELTADIASHLGVGG